MKISLYFPGPAVQTLLEHARAHEFHYPLPPEIPQRQIAEIGTHRDLQKSGPGLWLVIKDGIYLTSNSYPIRLGPVYAAGGEPTGVDCGEVVEFLPASLPEFSRVIGEGILVTATFSPPSRACRVELVPEAPTASLPPASCG